MVDAVILDEEEFVPAANRLNPTIKTALWDFVERVVENPDDPDFVGVERDGYRASQFTSGWILDWQVTRRQKSWFVDLFIYGAPKEIKLWNVRQAIP